MGLRYLRAGLWRSFGPFAVLLAAIFLLAGCVQKESAPAKESAVLKSVRYQDLLALWKEFREFQKPSVTMGIPDYTAPAMAAQKKRAAEFQNRLAAIDPSAWPTAEQVDYHIVRAEMNGLDFDHRVLRPWAKDPCFYATIELAGPDVPAREGPQLFGTLCLSDFTFPLNNEEKPAFETKLKAIPGYLAQAKSNLTEYANDNRILGIRQKKDESADLENLAKRLAGIHPDLVAPAEKAKAAVDDFRAWLEANPVPGKGPSGLGVAEYDWYMKNVHLVPYGWKEQMDLVQRELERAVAYLKLEELKNRNLPALEPAASREEQQRRLLEGNATFFDVLRKREIFTVPEYMHLDTDVRSFVPPERRDFFTQVEYRDVLSLRCHSVHWLEKQREKFNTHPLRGTPLLYNIWDSRAEGFATAFEEFMMGAGLFDKNPRGREIVYIMLAFRCIRAICDLRLHSHDWTVEDAVKYAVEATPRGWTRPDGSTIWGDLTIYLNQPGYGTSYVVGKSQFEKLMAEYAQKKGDSFRVKDFLDEYFTKGLIPAALIRWEMTGRDDEIKRLLK